MIALVWNVATYGCESWTLRKNEEAHLDAFELKGLRKILQVWWTANRTNKWVFNKAGVKRKLLDTVKARKLAYNGHTMRKQGSCLDKEIMQGTMPGTCRRPKFPGKSKFPGRIIWSAGKPTDSKTGDKLADSGQEKTRKTTDDLETNYFTRSQRSGHVNQRGRSCSTIDRTDLWWKCSPYGPRGTWSDEYNNNNQPNTLILRLIKCSSNRCWITRSVWMCILVQTWSQAFHSFWRWQRDQLFVSATLRSHSAFRYYSTSW